jgi:putative peptide maturation dehydrogenase
LLASTWNPLAALAHRHLRWQGVDVEIEAPGGLPTISDEALRSHLGAPPSPTLERADELEALLLPPPSQESPAQRRQRSTCRNFDPSRALSLDQFAQILHTVYGAQGHSIISGVPVLKKNSPSAGGLHPVEAYLLVQHVEGVEPGLYHYRPDTHVLEPLKALTAIEAREHARVFVAHQPWFVDAHVQVILAARFQRNFWKYRNHAKAYRAVILDAGHLSQMQYMVATELGLGAFITAAINEGDIEDAFGLDPMQEGVLAVTGFGYRGERMDVLEFDPLQKVWPEWQPE